MTTFLQNIRAWSLGEDDAEKIDQLFTPIEDGLGFQAFESIERAKHALSTREQDELVFEYPTIAVRENVTRADFERASQRVVDKILERLDDTLASAGLSANDVEGVRCTGGTAKVPVVARAIATKFPCARMEHFKSFHSAVSRREAHERRRVGTRDLLAASRREPCRERGATFSGPFSSPPVQVWEEPCS